MIAGLILLITLGVISNMAGSAEQKQAAKLWAAKLDKWILGIAIALLIFVTSLYFDGEGRV